MTKIYATYIKDNIKQEDKYFMESFLSPTRKQEIKQFKLYDDYLRSLIGEVMIRFQISRNTMIRPKDIIVELNKYGKPFIKNQYNVYFNISHSGDWVVGVISNSECGIDIEKKNKYDIDIVHQCFTKKEYEMIMGVEEKYQDEIFFDLWTLKESYIKADGRGMAIPLKNVEFQKKDGAYNLISSGVKCYNFKHIDEIIGYKIAVCMVDKQFEFQLLSIKEMIHFVKLCH